MVVARSNCSRMGVERNPSRIVTTALHNSTIIADEHLLTYLLHVSISSCATQRTFSFSIAGSSAWNDLPNNTRDETATRAAVTAPDYDHCGGVPGWPFVRCVRGRGKYFWCL